MTYNDLNRVLGYGGGGSKPEKRVERERKNPQKAEGIDFLFTFDVFSVKVSI